MALEKVVYWSHITDCDRIAQAFVLYFTMESIGPFGSLAKQEFKVARSN